jgi:hypothetical protein
MGSLENTNGFGGVKTGSSWLIFTFVVGSGRRARFVGGAECEAIGSCFGAIAARTPAGRIVNPWIGMIASAAMRIKKLGRDFKLGEEFDRMTDNNKSKEEGRRRLARQE